MKKLIYLILLISTNLFSQNASVFNLQGILRTPTGQAVPDGKYKFTFKLYDEALAVIPLKDSSGVETWIDTQPEIEVKNGIYNVLVGAKKSFAGLKFDKTYYVGISIADGAELSPRIQLTAAPYALSLQGSGNKVPNDGPMTFSSDVYHKTTHTANNTEINLERIRFNKGDSIDIKGKTAFHANAATLQLVGIDKTWMEFFPRGKSGGRKGYFGVTEAGTNDIALGTDVANANIHINTSGTGVVNINSNLKVHRDYAAGSNVMVKVAELTSADFNTSQIIITGLDGNKHKKYKVYYELYREGNSTTHDYLHIRFNSDDGGNYRFESTLKYYGSSHHYPNHDVARHAFVPIFDGWAKSGWFIGEFTVFANTGGITTGYQRNVYGTANFIGDNHNPAHGIWSGYWMNKTDNITSINFAGHRTFHAGTITVYAIP